MPRPKLAREADFVRRVTWSWAKSWLLLVHGPKPAQRSNSATSWSQVSLMALDELKLIFVANYHWHLSLSLQPKCPVYTQLSDLAIALAEKAYFAQSKDCWFGNWWCEHRLVVFNTIICVTKLPPVIHHIYYKYHLISSIRQCVNHLTNGRCTLPWILTIIFLLRFFVLDLLLTWTLEEFTRPKTQLLNKSLWLQENGDSAQAICLKNSRLSITC